MTDPRADDFWRLELLALWEVISPLAARALMIGARAAASVAPAAVSQLADWELFNQSAIDYLRRYRLDTVSNINAATRRAIIQEMDNWVRSGEHLDVLKDRLRALPTLSSTRADNIAVTEVTRIFARGKKAYWRSTGIVTAQVWRTARDERVCPICAPLHGVVVSIDGDFPFDAGAMAQSDAMRGLLGDNWTQEAGLRRANQLIRHLGNGVSEPPAHPRCRCDIRPQVSEVAFAEQIEGILNA